MRLRPLFSALAAIALSALIAPAAHAKTARDLSTRIKVDGYTDDFINNDEDIFGLDPRSGRLQEPNNDSKSDNPQNEELYQIRITWDAEYLYIAVEAKCWGNNVILLLDTVPGQGMNTMTSLNSWRRNFDFDKFARYPGDEFAPDVLGATWDGNPSARFLTYIGSNQVLDLTPGAEFNGASSFSGGADGRAMELAIPWRNVFAGLAGAGTRDTTLTVGGVQQVFHRMPLGVHSIKVAAVMTGGWDGSGGPDSAPDCLQGHTNDWGANVLIDNYATVDLDDNDDTGIGHGGPDGIPDWDVKPITRVAFRYAPPVDPLRFSLRDLSVDRPAFAPDRNERLRLHARVAPPLDPTLEIDRSRKVTTSANIYDLKGHWVRNLFTSWTTEALHFEQDLDSNPAAQWDGRDPSGNIVPAGIYVVRFVIEPNEDRATRAVVVVR